MLTANRLSKEYNAHHAVKPISLVLEKGKRYALVGESGSGKTTLARMLAGIIPPTTGNVMLDDKEIFLTKDSRAVYKKIQIVFQDSESSLNPQMTVYELIAEPLRNLLNISRAEERVQVSELMERMGLCPEYCKRKPRELSGGQQKRVCIARAIGVRPEVIIFDESFTGLDVIVRKQILELLDDLQKELKCSYLIITHDIGIALYIADTIFVMRDGEIVECAQYQGNTDCFKHDYSQLLLQ